MSPLSLLTAASFGEAEFLSLPLQERRLPFHVAPRVLVLVLWVSAQLCDLPCLVLSQEEPSTQHPKEEVSHPRSGWMRQGDRTCVLLNFSNCSVFRIWMWWEVYNLFAFKVFVIVWEWMKYVIWIRESNLNLGIYMFPEYGSFNPNVLFPKDNKSSLSALSWETVKNLSLT